MASMGLFWLLLVALALSLSLCAYGVEEMASISKEEDLELERQLKILNKPPIKTVQSGPDIFDCVDINKQPAFDHPLMKGHKVQTTPPSHPKQLIDGTWSREKHSRVIPLNRIGCPQGTVPIQRISKEDLIRAKEFSKSFATNINHPQTTLFPGQHQTVLRSKDEFNKIYIGTYAYMDVYNVTVDPDQSTSSQMWVEKGQTSLQAGWTVSPGLLKDGLTRTFAYWTRDGGKTGCLNTLCPGFVQVNPDHPVNNFITPTSVYGGDQYVIILRIYQAGSGGDWWLTINNDTHLGYWPKFLVPELSGGATNVAWGGFVTGPPNKPGPPMGNGHRPNGDIRKACFISRIEYVNSSNYQVNPEDGLLEGYKDNPETCYDLQRYGYVNKELGQTFLFGGQERC